MEQKMSFDDSVVNYDKYRSVYLQALFGDLFNYSNCNSSSLVVEVGCGTGQATSWVLNTGCTLKAIEIGKNLCDFTAHKFRDFRNLEVINTSFEDYEIQDGSLDLIYSATAFHWIPYKIAYPKALKALKKGGCLATFWCNWEVSDKNDKLKKEITALENEYNPPDNQSFEDRCKGNQWFFNHYGYKDFFSKYYSVYRKFTAEEYIGLLQTSSVYMKVNDIERESLFEKIRNTINEYGCIQIHDKIDLYMGRA